MTYEPSQEAIERAAKAMFSGGRDQRVWEWASEEERYFYLRDAKLALIAGHEDARQREYTPKGLRRVED